MTKILLLPLMIYAACGFVLSLSVHLLSFAGLQPPGNALFVGLHIAIFPLWIPVVLITTRMTSGARRKDTWKLALSACPVWMKYVTFGFFAYAIVNFAIFFFMVPMRRQSDGAPPSAVWHGFSGHWMLFYWAALAILTGAYRNGLSNLAPKCPNGHATGVSDRYCAVCGAPIDVRPGQGAIRG